ncbi:hypothetical protein GPJ56_002298 [Histomonas meleagridis]|uniref:uncharacterized protein n=1 Tax=Histomonas meleagridis TaxID=135588 RepID=UPI0035595F92|nr:hypothetical protein GPJ56_002298 [Histomonas meleagridis]KAH0804559.1 hypothetical protein GO595_003389 [Histomonas meleagridis]
MELETAFGTKYQVNIPKEQSSALYTDSTPIYVAPNGDVLSKFYDVLQEHSSVQRQKIPNPIDYNSKQEYENATWDYYFQFSDLTESRLLPVPVGFSFQRPSNCHVPTIQEKTPKTYENRLAAKTFSIINTPLYPQNHLALCSSLISGAHITDEYFPSKGPRGENIPIKYHFQEEVPWKSKLIPQKPLPQLFKTYDEYAYAMRKWYEISSKYITIPLHSRDLEQIINIDAAPPIPIEAIQPVEQPNLIKFDFSEKTFAEKKLKETTEMLLKEYTAFTQPSLGDRTDQHFPQFFESCLMVVVNCIDYGIEEPLHNNMLYKGLSLFNFDEVPQEIMNLSLSKPRLEILIETWQFIC